MRYFNGDINKNRNIINSIVDLLSREYSFSYGDIMSIPSSEIEYYIKNAQERIKIKSKIPNMPKID